MWHCVLQFHAVSHNIEQLVDVTLYVILKYDCLEKKQGWRKDEPCLTFSVRDLRTVRDLWKSVDDFPCIDVFLQTQTQVNQQMTALRQQLDVEILSLCDTICENLLMIFPVYNHVLLYIPRHKSIKNWRHDVNSLTLKLSLCISAVGQFTFLSECYCFA